MLLTYKDGLIANDPETINEARAAGMIKCMNPSCPFWLSQEAQHNVEKAGGYYTCPRCNKTFNLIHEPWVRPGYGEYEGDGYHGSGTGPSGLSAPEIGQLGEDVVSSLKDLPGYGPITWWHSSSARDQSPLDGATKDWGVEVKTNLADAIHHRFIAGGARPTTDGTRHERDDKNAAAEEMGKLGVLGLLVILDMRRSVADIYAKAMPNAGWQTSQGKTYNGVTNFRSNTGEHLIAEVPFKNPYMDPSHPGPHGPESTSAFDTPEESMPF